MVVSNHFSNYTPLHCASDGAPAGFGRMLRWAEGWLGQEAGVQTSRRGRQRCKDGTQGPGDHTSPSLLPRASRGPGPWRGEFPGAQTQLSAWTCSASQSCWLLHSHFIPSEGCGCSVPWSLPWTEEYKSF